MKLHLYLLGKKGLEVAKVALGERFVPLIDLVIVGEDANIDNDFSADITDLCSRANVSYCLRSEFKSSASVNESIAVAAGWRWLIKEDYKSVLVFHDSLLPRYRGFNPLVSALLNKDEFVGASVIVASESFDEGNILSQEQIHVDYPVKLAKVFDNVAALYAQLAVDTFAILENGHIPPGRSQDESLATYSVWRDAEDYRIDWNESASDIAHFVNCVGSPYSGASSIIDGEQVRIIEATPVDDVVVENRDVGKVLFTKHGHPVVICGAGLLEIIRLEDDQGASKLPLQRFRVRFK